MGVCDSTECPKLGVSSAKDTAKTNKDLGMSCYIQVEYSGFFYDKHKNLLLQLTRIIIGENNDLL